ncbi:MAG: sugar phosphate isomerase/epimerase family protein, partial [Armatimonadota bacterium]
ESRLRAGSRVSLRDRLLVNAFSLPHACGLLPTKDGSIPARPVGISELVEYAKSRGLAGIDGPLPAGSDPAAVGERLARDSMRFVAEFGDLHAMSDDTAARSVLAGARGGASTIRFLVSPILCGARAECPVGWEDRLRAVSRRLRHLLPIADDAGVFVAVENHQDLDSEDLLRLADAVHAHPRFGIVFDTGNPLAVAEDPLDFLKRVVPLVRHVHLKDYQMHLYEHGYRLVRCPAGEGVVPFESLLGCLESNATSTWTAGVEVAAQATRSIPVCDFRWLSGYSSRSLETFAPVLRTLLSQGIAPDRPYGSLWESGASSMRVTKDEWQVLDRSVGYFLGRAHGREEVSE